MELIVDDGRKLYEAADLMGMSPSTAATHFERIRKKLGARTRPQAAVFFDRTRSKK